MIRVLGLKNCNCQVNVDYLQVAAAVAAAVFKTFSATATAAAANLLQKLIESIMIVHYFNLVIWAPSLLRRSSIFS